MARKPTDRPRPANDSAEPAEGNVDKIRDILFGGQMRDYEQRFDAIEKRLTQIVAQAARDLERRIERLDAFTRREVDKIAEQLKIEKKDRIAEDKKGAADLDHLTTHVETWFAEVDDEIACESKELRSALADQNEVLAAQVVEVRDDITREMRKETENLNGRMLRREDMAALLTELALRLNEDFKLPKT